MPRPLTLSDIPEGAWDHAAGTNRTPMQHRIWAEAYAETLARGPVGVYTVGPADAPSAIAPFAVPVDGANRRTLLGAEDLWESVEVAAADMASLKTLTRTLARTGKPLRFGHYPVDGDFIRLLKQAYGRLGYVAVKPASSHAMPRIVLDTSWREPEANLSSRRRSDLRRMARRADEFGTVTYDIHDTFDDTLTERLDEAFAVEAQNWKGREGTAVSVDGRKADFYRTYARKAADAGILRLCFMRIDGVAAAMQYAVVCDGAFWLLKIGYDERYRRCSPGNLLMRETIAYAASNGLARYEFLGKEASWTRLWASDARPVASVRTYPFTPSGGLALAGDGIDLLLKRWRASRQPPSDAPASTGDPDPAKPAAAAHA